jgi:hypothetical protein
MHYLKPFSTALFSALLVSGAYGQGQATLMAPQEISAQWVGKKILARDPKGNLLDFKLISDGTAEVAGSSWSDKGTWRLSSDGYCATWKKIRAGQERCFTVQVAGTTVTILNPDQSVSGVLLRVSDQ